MKRNKTHFKNLYIDQYGSTYYASSVKELRSKIGMGGSKVHKMYQDIATDRYHIGYVIGSHWLRKYEVVATKEA